MTGSYEDLRARLERPSDEPRSVVTLPDGSVDRVYALEGRRGERLDALEAFVRHLRSGVETFPLDPVETRPGGQAVNAALQAHALGDAVTLAGHLDHEVFEDLPVETRSMGAPARITVVAFDDEEVLFPEPGPREDWCLEDLLAALEWDRLTAADAWCCANWVSMRGLAEVFERLASVPPATRDDDPLSIVVDPGRLEVVDPAALAGFLETLARADAAAGVEVPVSVNPTEFAALERASDAADETESDGASGDDAGRLEADPPPSTDRVAALRSAIGITGVVSHGPDAAVGSFRSRAAGGAEAAEAETTAADDPEPVTTSVPMLKLEEPQFTTGAGDRFSGALACALARGWSPETALALGNACAAAFVGDGETASPSDLRAFLRDHERKADAGVETETETETESET